MLEPTATNPLQGDDLAPYTLPHPTFLSLLRATRSRFRRATALSRVGNGEAGSCFYAHTTNGIGCAIGCHVPGELAWRMDAFQMSIAGFFSRHEPGERGQEIYAICAGVEKAMDVRAIGFNNLTRLQKAHDTSTSVAEFLGHLELLIAAEEAAPL